jgi:hypothetical protein
MDNMADMATSRRSFISAMMTIIPGVLIVSPRELRAARKRSKELVSKLEMEILELSRPKWKSSISCNTTGDKNTLYRKKGDKKIPICGLNNTGKIIWDSCTGNNSLKDICGLVLEKCQVTEDRARKDILVFLSGLKKLGAITL